MLCRAGEYAAGSARSGGRARKKYIASSYAEAFSSCLRVICGIFQTIFRHRRAETPKYRPFPPSLGWGVPTRRPARIKYSYPRRFLTRFAMLS